MSVTCFLASDHTSNQDTAAPDVHSAPDQADLDAVGNLKDDVAGEPLAEALDSAPPDTIPVIEGLSKWLRAMNPNLCPLCHTEGACRRSPDGQQWACCNVQDYLGQLVKDQAGTTYTLFSPEDHQKKVEAEIARTLQFFHPTGVIELRIFKKGTKEVIAGYFTSPLKAARAAAKIECDNKPDGIYFVLNPLSDSVLARSPNRLTAKLQPTASDPDVLRLCWLFIDLDPERPAGVPSTTRELAAAVELAGRIKAWLRAHGFTDPVEAASGNGRHLLYCINLPNDRESVALLKQILITLQKEVAEPFNAASDVKCNVDQKTFNPARIDKLYGTMARKGCALPGQPWRRSRLLCVPEDLAPVPLEALRAVADLTTSAAPKPKPRTPSAQALTASAQKRPQQQPTTPTNDHPRLRVEDWLLDKDFATRMDGTTADGRVKYLLDCCLFNDQHRGKEAAILQDDAGKVAYHCFHASCSGYKIADVAERIGFPERHHFDGVNGEGPYLLIEQWLTAHGITARPRLMANGSTAYPIPCPFDPTHTDACLFQRPDGKLGARCKGEGCENHHWRDFKEKIGRPGPNDYDPPLSAVQPEAGGGGFVVPRKSSSAAFDPGFLDSPTFAAGNFKLEWLVQSVLVRNQPILIGGPQKAMKTSVTIDLVLSLGSGKPFLGQFAVKKPLCVAILSGESGEAVLQETALRICAAKGITLPHVNALWGFALPQLANADQMDCLRRQLLNHKVEVLVVDPLYLCLLSGQAAEGVQASNLYHMGPLLLSVAKTCLEAGCTPILLHHTRKTLAEPFQPLDLQDLAFSGVGEFARQWLLLSRRQAYTPGTGLHHLWLSVGGSAGQGGLWAVDVDEGVLKEDFTGRRWQVTVEDGTKVRQARKDEKQARKEHDENHRLLDALDGEDPEGKGAVFTKVRARAGMSNDVVRRIVNRLAAADIIEEVEVEITAGKGAKRQVRGLRRLSEGSSGSSGSLGGWVDLPMIPEMEESSGSSGQEAHLFDDPDD